MKYSIDELAFQIKKVVSLGDVTVVDLSNGITYAIRETDDVAEAARPAYREVIQGIWKYSGKTADEIAEFYFSKVANKTRVSGKFSGSASDILRAELKDAGVITPPYKHKAHHIIPEGMDVPELNEVRAIMQRYGVDLNSASNGQTIPEFTCNSRLNLYDGAELYEVGKDGREVLRAIFDDEIGKFVSIIK